MIVFLNGRFIPEEQALVSVFDRSFLYGDGLFETMLVANGVPFRWEQHIQRLEAGAAFLGITIPIAISSLQVAVADLIGQNKMPNAILRLSLSRGVGIRGYSPRGAYTPNLVMTLHPATGCEPGELRSWRLMTSSFRLPANEPLAQFKTCNKLAQILARAQADQNGAEEALLVNTDGHAVEGASSNLFWIQSQTVFTPPLASGILSGVTRQVVLELCKSLGFEVQERNINASELLQVDGVFLSLSTLGVVQGISLDGRPLKRSALLKAMSARYFETVETETKRAVFAQK